MTEEELRTKTREAHAGACAALGITEGKTIADTLARLTKEEKTAFVAEFNRISGDNGYRLGTFEEMRRDLRAST